MPSSIAFRRGVDELGRFIDRSERIPQQTRASVEKARDRLVQVSNQIVEMSQNTKEIYVDDVAVDPQARSMVSFLI